MGSDLDAVAIDTLWRGGMDDCIDTDRVYAVLSVEDADQQVQWCADLANFIASRNVVTQISF